VSDRAVIEATLEGGQKVVTEADKIKKALTAAQKAAEDEAKTIAGSLSAGIGKAGIAAEKLHGALSPAALFGGAVLGGAVMSGLGAIVGYFGEAKDAAQDFQEKTATTSRRTGTDVSSLRDTYSKLEVETLQSAEANDAFVRSLQETTYGGADAINSLRGLDIAATLSGRSITDLSAIMQALSGSLQVHDLDSALASIDEMAKRLGVNGGPKAFQDSLVGLRNVMSQMGPASEGARAKLFGIQAVLQKRMAPEQARQAAQGMLNYALSHEDDIRRLTGYNARDKNGQLKDPEELVHQLHNATSKKAAFKRLAVRELGGLAGMALVNYDHDAVERIARDTVLEAHDPDSMERRHAKQERDMRTLREEDPVAARKVREAKAAGRLRKAGAPALAASDAIGSAYEGTIQTAANPWSWVGGGSSGDVSEPVGPAQPPPTGGVGSNPVVAALVKGIQDLIAKTPTADEQATATARALGVSPPVIKVQSHPNHRRGN
jgi:hypothetical protein